MLGESAFEDMKDFLVNVDGGGARGRGDSLNLYVFFIDIEQSNYSR